MAEPSLSDFFQKKTKKKIKGSNLNNQTADKKTESKKVDKKDAEEEGWEEEQVVAAVMKVEVAGKLTREEDKKDEDDSSAPAWGTLKHKESSNLNDKRFPTLAKATQSSNINIDDGSDAKINIQTSKNAFSALEGGQDSDDEGKKRPKEIKPAMIQKKKGESEKQALQREVQKYTAKKDGKKKAKKEEDEESDSEEEESEAEEEAAPAPAAAPEKKKKKPEAKKNEKKEDVAAEEEKEEELEEDVKIQPDLAASKAKYEGRKKLPKKELPAEELAEEKKEKKAAVANTGKKKKIFVEEEDEKSKRLQVLDE